MKLIWQISFRNLLRAGVRTWVNVSMLALVFIIIVFYNGLLTGWDEKARTDSIAWEFGYGHLTHVLYDKYDPFSIPIGNGPLPSRYSTETLDLTPVLVWRGSLYPNQTQFPVILKGIPRDQGVLRLPVDNLSHSRGGVIPVMMGELMAEATQLQEGDTATLRWRDKNHTFDAIEVRVVSVFKTDVPTAEQGQVYIALDDLWEMTGLHGHATYWIAGENYIPGVEAPDWVFRSQEELLKPFDAVMASEKGGALVTNSILMLLALLAIFNTQVMTIFHRQKEIGTYIALGMTRLQVIGIFTFEGSMSSLLGMVVGGLIGAPFFYYLSQEGLPLEIANAADYGIPLGDKIIPAFYFDTILMVVLIIFFLTSLVGFLPSRKIAAMNPVDALKGKIA